MAITATLVTSLAGGKVDFIPITPNGPTINQVLPAGTWLVQVEAVNNNSSRITVTLNGISTNIPSYGSQLVTRLIPGGELIGRVSDTSYVTFTHGVAIRLGD